MKPYFIAVTLALSACYPSWDEQRAAVRAQPCEGKMLVWGSRGVRGNGWIRPTECHTETQCNEKYGPGTWSSYQKHLAEIPKMREQGLCV